MTSQELTRDEAERIVYSDLPKIVGNYIYFVRFPGERNDVCAVVLRVAGYWAIYLVWKEADGQIKKNRIGSNQGIGGIMFIDKIYAVDDSVIVEYGNKTDDGIQQDKFESRWEDFSKWWR